MVRSDRAAARSYTPLPPPQTDHGHPWGTQPCTTAVYSPKATAGTEYRVTVGESESEHDRGGVSVTLTGRCPLSPHPTSRDTWRERAKQWRLE
ncbi:Hypp7298 [Branchiostoma lanceolatum]|uniref:Hypp7298 protein n=1 Tax=Branchiostoma lanceolatum TaxID=7740 RepID=A0A8K0EDB8_BRALA|nr:Hypp7298 [Branchiostoma lanceolatum]